MGSGTPSSSTRYCVTERGERGSVILGNEWYLHHINMVRDEREFKIYNAPVQCSRSISSKPNFTRSSTRYKSNQASADWGKRWGKISGRKHRWIPLPTHPHLSGSRGRLKIRESSRVTVDSASSGQVSNSSVRRISRTARDEGAMVVAPMRAACHRSWKRALWQRISARRMNGRQSISVPVCFLYLELLVPSGGITNFACVCLRSQR